MFMFVKSDIITQEFYDEERNALIPFRDSMVSNLNIHGNWTGPPCRNNMSRWIGIGCSNSHVIHLTLESINLTGTLPVNFLQNVTFLSKLSLDNNSITGDLPNLTNLVFLESIFLSRNHFSGPIPLNYIELPKLTTLELQENEITGTIPSFDQDSLTALNLSYNQLYGPIPDTKILQRFSVGSFNHNSGLCGQPVEISCESPSKDKKKKAFKVWSIIMIAAAAAIVPFFVILGLYCCYRRFQRKQVKKDAADEQRPTDGAVKKARWSASTSDPERTVDLEFVDNRKPVFDIDELLRSSAEVLGKGSLGTTYKATMESGLVVVVKRLRDMNSISKKEFVQQMQLLGKLRHQNLVEMTSFYYSKEEKLVIHEFIQDGSLFELLHESRGIGRIPLSWATRLEIMKDVAKGLIFLQQSLSYQKVSHGNLKSSNVLIHFTGETTHAKLTDFGYLPLLPSSQKSSLAIGKCPEVLDGKKPTHKSDVYCFGMLLLEVITGKVTGDGNHEDLSDWVKSVVNTDWSMDIFDLEMLVEKEGHEDMFKIAELALECMDETPERRPKMSQILIRLEEIHHLEIGIVVN
ncbi:probable leucine-rich repeat receptor-like protein kinase At1g68400 [Rutidosis leptorrhynchoides]|uniref:probable leucine-rich repeat receptor-like protein kinase At1g68400 n=1 Tax=Rutidosis leptorrhynchoides TaxID=125765 RepID=UPI003A99A2C6